MQSDAEFGDGLMTNHTDVVPVSFTYQDVEELRTVMLDSTPYLIAVDVCRILGLRDTSSALKVVDDEDKRILRRSEGPHLMRGFPPQVNSVAAINESGLYTLVFRSDKPDAVTFRRWVTATVLPEIGKTGSYGKPAAPPSRKVLAQWVIEAEERAELAEARVAEMAPQAAAWNALAEATGDSSVADAAKVLCRAGINTGRDRLFAYMAQIGWIFRHQGHWAAYQVEVNNGRLVEKLGEPYWNARYGEYRVGAPTLRITPKGLQALLEMMAPGSELAPVGVRGK